MKPIYEYLINKQTKNKHKYHPKTVSELEKIILQEMEIQETYECDLNCIDTSEVTVMGWLFQSIPELRKLDGQDVTPADFIGQDSNPKESDMSDEVFANFGDSIEISDDDIAF